MQANPPQKIQKAVVAKEAKKKVEPLKKKVELAKKVARRIKIIER